ncbi:MAG: hypothetical protein J5733_09025, partial [Bacteroidaceae bacterium]|nr:hypothetical protein [Bacteroidaceae bacterium]
EAEHKFTEKQDYSSLNDLERAIHRGFLCAGVENVPVTIIKETAQECLTHLPKNHCCGDCKYYNDEYNECSFNGSKVFDFYNACEKFDELTIE